MTGYQALISACSLLQTGAAVVAFYEGNVRDGVFWTGIVVANLALAWL